MRKEIHLAGGCFWGVEKYISLIPGVISTEVGYANGKTENPSYEEVCSGNTGHAETVKIQYETDRLSLPDLLDRFYEIIDPTSLNRQGNDKGAQYRTGIYYTDRNDLQIITSSLQKLQTKYSKPLAVEATPLDNYYKAEEYHQKYLDKNPQGYCHIPSSAFKSAGRPVTRQYVKPSEADLRKGLSALQYQVTQQSATEPPFKNEYFDHFKEGIYVDITTGEPLFVSTDKFESGCGWPSFSKPIDPAILQETLDKSHGMRRMEVRSQNSGAHLGHVFNDGPAESGGLRYCINSASLRFVAKENMEREGYGEYLHLL